jgi:hypothetical protein
MGEDLFGLLQVFNFEFLTVKLSFLLLQILLDFLLDILELSDILPHLSFCFLVITSCLNLCLHLLLELLLLILESLSLPAQSFHIISQLVNNLAQLFALTVLSRFNCGDFIIVLFLLHLKFLFVDHFQLLGFFL